MIQTTNLRALAWRRARKTLRRRGAFLPVAAVSLTAALAFVALSTDLSIVSLTRTRMQNAVDAAALAAAQEITAAVATAGDNAGQTGDAAGAVNDANSIAVASARAMAAKVAGLNGVYVDPDQDVRFGKRVFSQGQFSIQWDVAPYNVVKVTARRDNGEAGHPDSQLSLFFAGVTGNKYATITTSAISFIEARDIVIVLDYSSSMNDDSTFSAFSKLGQTNVEANMLDIWNALGPPPAGTLPATAAWLTQSASGGSGLPTVTTTFRNTAVDVTCGSNIREIRLVFSDGSTQSFTGLNAKSFTRSGTGSNSGKTINEVRVRTPNTNSNFAIMQDTVANVRSAFGLNSVTYPYAVGSWDDYINFVRSNSTVNNAGYRRRYGGLTMVQYLLSNRFMQSQTRDLWKTPHYPFHAMKEGTTLFTSFLAGLEFGDEVGLVNYDVNARIESAQADLGDGQTADLGSNLITSNHAAIEIIQRHKQAGNYASRTNIAAGILEGKNLLLQHMRYGARPTMFLMTDGNANEVVANWSMPAGWNWNTLTDYDGDGVANYSTSDSAKLCALVMAKQAIDAGITIHTLSIGADADRDLMKAIAYMGKGQWIDAPGGSRISDIQGQLLVAFSKIAANVPPAKLLADPSAP